MVWLWFVGNLFGGCVLLCGFWCDLMVSHRLGWWSGFDVASGADLWVLCVGFLVVAGCDVSRCF